MGLADLGSAVERAVLERVRSRLAHLEPPAVVGIRSAEPPRWDGPPEQDLDGRRVRIEPCPSVLAVLDALARRPGDVDVLVVLTDRPENELGDDVLARLHRGRLLDAGRHTLLDDVLGARALDPQIRHHGWLVDALIDLAHRGALPSPTHGTALSLRHATSLVLRARLGLDPEQLDLPRLVTALDDPATRNRWRAPTEAERDGLVGYLGTLLGSAARAVCELALRRDDLLAELLVADVLTTPPESDSRAAVVYGRFTQSRFGAVQPRRTDLRAAGAAASAAARGSQTPRTSQQLRRADILLEELTAADLAVHSAVLPRGYTERLAAAAADLSEPRLAAVADHRSSSEQPHRLERLRCAARLRRWVASKPGLAVPSVADGLRRHARELAWVDRALSQVRAGDPDPRVQRVLSDARVAAEQRRAELDVAFAARLASVDTTPAAPQLAVETVLRDLVAPLAARHPVLLVVIDGMAGSVATELADALTSHRGGWIEVVRAEDGGREAVLAALPTETTYSRTSLLTASLRTGMQDDERRAFAAHRFWPKGGARLVHKAGVAGRDGNDLGSELEQALQPDGGERVVGVVLNAVDDALTQGRQSVDPSWSPRDVPGLPQLLDRAAFGGRVVVLTSDHGHVLEHDSEHRPAAGGGARWRPADQPAGSGEVLVTGSRVLAPGGRAVLAATEGLRYGPRKYGYHGGASLAEVAIPLLALLPPGLDTIDGWYPHTLGALSWWSGDAAAPPAPAVRPRQRRTTPPAAAPDLFTPQVSRGIVLIASETFRTVHSGLPANRVPEPDAFAAVVDALVTAGGRLPVAAVLQAAQTPGRNPRGFVTALQRVLNVDGFAVLSLVDEGRTVVLDQQLLDEQFPPEAP